MAATTIIIGDSANTTAPPGTNETNNTVITTEQIAKSDFDKLIQLSNDLDSDRERVDAILAYVEARSEQTYHIQNRTLDALDNLSLVVTNFQGYIEDLENNNRDLQRTVNTQQVTLTKLQTQQDKNEWLLPVLFIAIFVIGVWTNKTLVLLRNGRKAWVLVPFIRNWWPFKVGPPSSRVHEDPILVKKQNIAFYVTTILMIAMIFFLVKWMVSLVIA